MMKIKIEYLLIAIVVLLAIIAVSASFTAINTKKGFDSLKTSMVVKPDETAIKEDVVVTSETKEELTNKEK